MTPDEFAEARRIMVDEQLVGRGIVDEQVLAAMGEVPRERFVPDENVAVAYGDHPLSIAESQTISQPYIVAFMLEAARLQRGDKLLEVGTGSGYATAVASRIVDNVWGIERHDSLVRHAGAVLDDLGYANVTLRRADGTLGWPDAAPFDAILVAAAAEDVPAALIEQLREGGRLILPLGRAGRHQELLRLTKGPADSIEREALCSVAFVPLIAG